MLVFPANNDEYRRRKRALRACEQCKRRRKRCETTAGFRRCEPCTRAGILCSLAPDEELVERESRLDALANGQMSSATSEATTTDSIGTSSPALARPTLSKRSSSAASVPTSSTFIKQEPDVIQRLSTPSPSGWLRLNSPVSSHNSEHAGPSSLIPNRAPSPAPTTSGLKRPALGPRATSYTHAKHQKHTLQPPQIAENLGHRRTGSHSPGMASKPSPAPFDPSRAIDSLFQAPAPLADGVDREFVGVWVKGVSSQQQRLDPHLQTYLSSINAFSMPLRPDREALIRIYCDSIHRILPLLDKQQFLKLHSIGQAPTLLLHSVLLAAARHPRAAQHLGHESVRQFCSSTTSKIRALLFAEVEQDRLTLVRTYALLSLHSEGPDGLENSCADLQKSIHYAMSLGIHHNRPFVDRDQLQILWWSIWCMDRISACVNARALIITNDDIDMALPDAKVEPQLSRLIVSCQKLERVVILYRPTFDLPTNNASFIPEEVDRLFMGDDTVDPTNAIQALLHHTAVILAHKRVKADNGKSDNSDSVTKASPRRQSTVLNESAKSAATTAELASQLVSGTPSLVPDPDRVSDGRESLSVPMAIIMAQEKRRNTDLVASQAPEDDLTIGAGSLGIDDDDSGDIDLAVYGPEFEDVNMSGSGLSDTAQTDARLLSAAGSLLRIIQYAKDLPPLPLVPYCASLTLTVFLRVFPLADSETGLGWKDSCDILESMASRWWVAGAMGTMGRSIFKSLEEEVNAQQEKAQHDDEIRVQQKRQQQEVELLEQQQRDQLSFAAEVASLTGDVKPDLSFLDSRNTSLTEEQYLDMFSNLPNQTSFLDEAITMGAFDNVEQWLREKS